MAVAGGVLTAFCRDCVTPQPADGARCTYCGSPRLQRHAELGQLSIAHIDCDAFYAAVEKRDNPELRDKPVIVGGGKRGVVSTCCYVARIYGVRSAMPMFKALALCPQAVVVKPNMARYVDVGREVRQLMLALTPLVEPLSLDEAFLDLSGTERIHGQPPALVLADLQRHMEVALGISGSVGLSYCKFLAKLASDLDKPRGFSVIGHADAVAVLGGLEVGRIWGVGKALQARLAADGIRTIEQLRAHEEIRLIARYGSIGRRLYRFARGIDERKVEPEREIKSVSAETTLENDVADTEQLAQQLWRLAEKVSARLKQSGLFARTVVLKLKTADFQTRTRNQSLDEPTQLAERLYQTALPLLRAEADGTRYRLIGIGTAGLASAKEADPPALLDRGRQRVQKIEAAMDAVREKFGKASIEKGRALAPRR
jgi:DNA polymerase-4